MSMSCCCDAVNPYVCSKVFSPWMTPTCTGYPGGDQPPKGWIVFVVRTAFCKISGADCDTDVGATCPALGTALTGDATGLYEALIVWNGFQWARAADNVPCVNIEERDNGDGTFSYRVMWINVTGLHYELNESLYGEGYLGQVPGTPCCLIDFKVDAYVTRRVWKASDVSGWTFNAVVDGYADSVALNCNGQHYAYNCDCNNDTWSGMPFLTGYELHDEFYLYANFDGKVFGDCGGDVGVVGRRIRGGNVSFLWGAIVGGFRGLHSYEQIQNSITPCTVVGTTTENDHSNNAGIDCASSTKYVLQMITADEWVFDHSDECDSSENGSPGGSGGCCDTTAATLGFNEVH